MNKIIRTICLFKKEATDGDIRKLTELQSLFEKSDFIVQTTRLCSPTDNFSELEKRLSDTPTLLSVGRLDFDQALSQLSDFYQTKNVSFNIELSQENLALRHTDVLFNIIRNASAKTFNFTYTFNNAPASPYFPSAVYQEDGFTIGLQPTDLSISATSLEEWFSAMQQIWEEVNLLAQTKMGYLGLDSSIAPLFTGPSSLINFIRRLGLTFDQSVLTDTYLKITRFIKEHNPQPIGLNGLMLPALEDFELADEYELGNFSLERNVFLSLHSGLGIDTYPIGIDESPQKVLNILQTVQGLSNKYLKPLSVRFVSDGKAKIGEETDFNNQYLKDVTVRQLF